MRRRWRSSEPHSQASPLAPPRRRGPPSGRSGIILGWVAVAALIGFVAFSVGRPSDDAGRVPVSPSPSDAGALAIAFGTALDPASGEAAGRTERFVSGETFAYSIRLSAPHGADTVHVEVLRSDPQGGAPVQTPAPQPVDPASSLIAFQVPADALLTAFGAGDFVMRIYLDPAAAPIAEGRFTLVAPAAPASSAAP